MAGPEYKYQVAPPSGPRIMVGGVPLIDVPRAPQLSNPVARRVGEVSDTVAGVAPVNTEVGRVGADVATVGTVAQVAGVASGDAAGRAMQGLGAELGHIGTKIWEGQQHTRATQGLTSFLNARDALTEQYKDDEDYVTAEHRFGADIADAKLRALERIDDPQIRARSDLEMTRLTISAQGDVRSSQLTRQKDINVSALDGLESKMVAEAVNAGTPEQKLAAITRYTGEVERNERAGWLDRRTALARRDRFNASIDEIDIRRVGQRDPAQAIALLADPAQLPNIDAARRQTLAEHFTSQLVGLKSAELGNEALTNPNAALVKAGVVQPQHYGRLFDAVVQVESNGDPSAVSVKGALGLSQIMRDTARDMAQRLGMPEVAALDDDALKARLLADPALNRQLGQAYWSWLGARYQGNVAAMLAGYNAGPKRADEWSAKAAEKYGPGFTLGQMAEFVTIGETRDYLGKFAAAAGVDLAAPAIPRNAQLHAAASVAGVLNQKDAEARRRESAVAAEARSGTNYPDMMRNGIPPDPLALEQAKALQRRAGGPEAAKWLEEVAFQESAMPVRDTAYRMTPVALRSTIDTIEAQHRAGQVPQADGSVRPATQLDISRLNVLVETYNDVVKRASSDPITLAERAGIIRAPVSFDPAAAPDSPEFVRALMARNAQGADASAFYQGAYKILKPPEADALKLRYGEAQPGEKFAILQSAARTLDQRGYESFMEQIGGGSADTLFAGRLARSRPELAREILAGQQLLGDKGVQERMKDVRPVLADKLGGQIYPSPDMQDEVVRAAIALDVTRKGRNGTLYDPADTSGLDKALDDVMGPVVKRNGRKVPVPPGMAPARFQDTLDHLSARDLATYGGAIDRAGRELEPSFISDRAVLIPMDVGSSRYMVGLPDRLSPTGFQPVFSRSEAGAPLIVDMRVLAEQGGVRGLTPYQRGRSQFRGGQFDRIKADTE